MIPFEKALEIVLANAPASSFHRIDFQKSLNYVLAENVLADSDYPSFHKSAMDGYACRMSDTQMDLTVVEHIPAGYEPTKSLEKGECAKIMTGASLPEGADCVLMVEHTTILPGGKIRYLKDSTKANVRFKGEDLKKGDVVLKKGTLLKPQDIAIMASVGMVSPLVAVIPKLGILSTGDELVEPDQYPSSIQIRNSNSYQLIAQCLSIGIDARYFGIVKDNEEHTSFSVENAIKESDVVLLSGGVSMGDYDHVPAALESLGFEVLFHNIAVQPGKPTMFARKGNKIVFGLPGNPVSSFNQFELLVKPLLYKMMGCEYVPLEFSAPMGVDYFRKKTERMGWFPVYMEKNEVFPVEYHGSAHIYALNKAVGLVAADIGVQEIKKGEYVIVRSIK